MTNVIKENIMYLNAWFNYNPSLKEDLTIDGNNLVYQNEKKIDISKFYLPDMLYNDSFREKISLENELSSLDLFEIISCYVNTYNILAKESAYPYIKEINIKKDNDKEFIAIIDNQNKKYRFDTNEPEKIINIYNDLKNKRKTVNLKEFGRVINESN